MRPGRSGPAHSTGTLAELVCSNSLRGAALENAVGLLKEELTRVGSLIVACARETAVPAGSALAVDRVRFSQLVESRVSSEPRITLRREEVRAIPRDRPVVVACGPLPSDEFLADLDALLASVQPESGRLHYYDAASPIVAAESIDESKMYRKSRYDKGASTGSGEADYINIPLDREQYAQLIHDLRTLERYPAKEFEETRFFEGCLPVEVMADRGEDALRFGPLKPVGLRDPRTDRMPHAVVQLRKENVEGTAYNLVGFQTRLTWPAQREAFGKLPGLEGAEWLRLGVMHRNTFIDSPRLLDARLKLHGSARHLFCRPDHRLRRLRRGGGLRRDDGNPRGPGNSRFDSDRVSPRDRLRCRGRAPAESRDAGFSAVQRHVGAVRSARRARASASGGRSWRSAPSRRSTPWLLKPSFRPPGRVAKE